MTKTKLAFVIFGLLNFLGPAFAQTNYSKTSELPALRISISDLQEVLTKLDSLVSVANGQPAPVWREEMQIEYQDLKISIPSHKLNPASTKVPTIFDSFEYTFSTRDSAAINNVRMRFGDYSRVLTISGNSPDQVDAVFSVLRGQLQALSTPFGGSGVKLILGAISFTALFLGVIILTIFYFDTRSKSALPPIAIALLLMILIFVLPFGDLLAGFVAVNGDASFMVRYGAQISFGGFILGLVALVISVIPLFQGQKPEPSTDTVAPRTKSRTGKKARN